MTEKKWAALRAFRTFIHDISCLVHNNSCLNTYILSNEAQERSI